MRRFKGAVLVAALVAVLATLLSPFQPAQQAVAAPVSGFDPGRIIDDSVFWNPTTMSAGSIQSFLNSKVPTCRAGYTCLKDYRQDTYNIAGTPMCSAYQGAAAESAAQIIYKVAQSCGINPQALIVMLQKEQGLVTDTWPTARQYRSAMGAGCPDTADCDATYYGFFDQVQYGAYLLRRYTQPPGTGYGTDYSSRFDLSYPVGKTSNIQYNPSASCGTKAVTVTNQATHALYVYTPYTPNDAALAAGYGIGNSCSAYGNRNFYLYFTDWFGNVRGSDLMRSPSNPQVYLVTASGRYYVPTGELVELLSPLGGVQTVAQSYLDRFPVRGDATPLVRDDTTGAISFIGGGKRYHFSSCEQIASFGFSCSSYTSLTSAQMARFADGGSMGTLIQAAGSATVYSLEGGAKRPIANLAALAAVGAKLGTTAVAAIAPSVVAKFPVGGTILAPGRLMKAPDGPEVWVTDGVGAKRHLTSFDIVRDLGLGQTIEAVSRQTVDAYPTSAPLSALISCGPDYYVGSGGGLVNLGTASGYGVPPVALDPSTCAAMPKKPGRTGSQSMTVQGEGSGTVYLVSEGVRRPFSSWNAYLQWSSRSGGIIVSGMSPTGLATWPVGAPVHAAGALIKAPADPTIYLVNGAAGLVWVRSFEVTSDLGFGTAVQTVPTLDGYTPAGELAAPVVTCGPTVHVADRGTLADATAATTAGLAAVALDATTCAGVQKSAATGSSLFVKTATGSTVYYVTGGSKRPVSSWSSLVALSGGQSPRIVTWSPGVVAALPTGPAA